MQVDGVGKGCCLPRLRHSSVYKAQMQSRQPELLGSKGRTTLRAEGQGAVPSAAELRGMGSEGCRDPQPGAGLAVDLVHCLVSLRLPTALLQDPRSGMGRYQEINYPREILAAAPVQVWHPTGNPGLKAPVEIPVVFQLQARHIEIRRKKRMLGRRCPVDRKRYTVWRGLRPCTAWQSHVQTQYQGQNQAREKRALTFLTGGLGTSLSVV